MFAPCVRQERPPEWQVSAAIQHHSTSHLRGSGHVTLATRERLLYSGHKQQQHAYVEEVTITLSESSAKALLECVRE